MYKINEFVINHNLGEIDKNKSFKDITTMKVGGKIKKLFYPSSIRNLITFVRFLEKYKKKYLMIGNGSNIIASDHTYKNIVISGKKIPMKLEINEEYFIVDAFTDLRKVNKILIDKNIKTFLNLSGIPATIGGAIVMNAGANDDTIFNNLIWVKYLEDGAVKKKEKCEIKFSYRNSEFKNHNIIILEAAFKTEYQEDIKLKYEQIMENRKNKHPLDYPNSGSIFKNTHKYKAYEIIKKINLVNYKIGGVCFSEKHANFIINLKNGKAKDVYDLIILAKKRAIFYEDVELDEEVMLINFYSYTFFKKILKN